MIRLSTNASTAADLRRVVAQSAVALSMLVLSAPALAAAIRYQVSGLTFGGSSEGVTGWVEIDAAGTSPTLGAWELQTNFGPRTYTSSNRTANFGSISVLAPNSYSASFFNYIPPNFALDRQAFGFDFAPSGSNGFTIGNYGERNKVCSGIVCSETTRFGTGGTLGRGNVYDLFVGVHDTGNIRGDIDATNMYNTVSRLPAFRAGTLLTADIRSQNAEGILPGTIRDAIAALKSQMQPGDTFIFYDSSHGSRDESGPETTSTPGDELLVTSRLVDLYDNNLATYLSGMDDIQKWVFLDSCFAGGFWGNNNPGDTGDLEKLSNIGLFTATDEDSTAAVIPWDGTGLYTAALLNAFELLNGTPRADADRDGDLTLAELNAWLSQPLYSTLFPGLSSIIEKAQGDLRPFTPEMWSPMTFTSADFVGRLSTGGAGANVSEPTPLSILASALALLYLRRRRSFRSIPLHRGLDK